jgi:hypothetical protein
VLERDELSVTDVVEDRSDASVESLLHFHPDFSVSVVDGRATAVKGSLRLSIEAFGVDAVSVVRGQLEPKQGWFCEEFGKAVAQDVVVMRIENNRGAEFGYRIRRSSGSS